MKRKLLAVLLSTAVAASVLTACGSSSSSSSSDTSDETEESEEEAAEEEEAEETDEEDSDEDTIYETSGTSGVTIELEYGVTGEQFDAFMEIIQGFTDETGIGVSVTQPGSGYENAMKTRMASGDLPDVWVTHGWSVARYSEYLEPLEDEEWYSLIDESLLPSITDEDGHIYVLPITEAVCGILYNEDVLEAAGVDATSIRTWDDFTEACQAITDAGYVAIEMSCNDSGVNQYMLECIFPSYFSNSDLENCYADDLNAGIFDFTSDEGLAVFELIAGWADAGYFNVDALTADLTTAEKALGDQSAGFMFYSTDCVPAILTYNPEANIGVLPVPGLTEDNASYFGVGEGNSSTFGIWKDTEYMDECKQFLEFMALAENADPLATDVDGGIPCLSTTEITDAYVYNKFKQAQSDFEGDLLYDNFFDREYLPSGMWTAFDDSIDALLDGTASDNIEEAAEIIQTNYEDLME